MLHLLLRWLLNTVALLIAAYFVRGMAFDSLGAAAVTAIVLALVNALVRPLFVILTLPLTVITLGLFLLVVNAIMLELADWLVLGFHLSSFWSALVGAVLLSLISLVTDRITRPRKEER